MKGIQGLALVRRACIIGTILLSTGLMARRAWPQELTGEIDGRMTDSSGAVVPNVTVTIRNEDQKNVARTVQTNAQGQFSVPLLPLARYSVAVSVAGFRPVETLVEVHTGITSTANMSLAPGAVTEQVNVTADSQIAPQIDSPAAGTLIPSTKVTQLSLSSRNFVQLVAIQPGVSGGIPGGTQDRGAISSAGKVNSANYEVNGIAANYNGFFLDGQDLQRRSAGGTQIGAYPGIDFIQKINLQRSTFGAQYGGSGSAYVSVATKSCTDSFHGALYSFYRSQILNANDYLNNLAGVPRPLIRYNDFGYEVGGPLWLPNFAKRASAKTFFVYGQEFLRSESTRLTFKTTSMSHHPSPSTSACATSTSFLLPPAR